MPTDNKEDQEAISGTGWATTNPTPSGNKYHYYEAGVSVCNYQRKAGNLTFMSKQTAAITNGCCSSCENTLRKRGQVATVPRTSVARPVRSAEAQRSFMDKIDDGSQYDGGPGIDYDPRC